jgi:hypothetical protein
VGVPQQTSTDLTTPLISAGPAADQAITDAAKAGTASYGVNSEITIRLYDDAVDHSKLSNSGTVKVILKK